MAIDRKSVDEFDVTKLDAPSTSETTPIAKEPAKAVIETKEPISKEASAIDPPETKLAATEVPKVPLVDGSPAESEKVTPSEATKELHVLTPAEKRIHQLVGKNKALERQAAETESRLKELETRLTTSSEDKEPKMEDFQDWDQFQAANTEWLRKKVRGEEVQRAADETTRKQHQDRITKAEENFEAKKLEGALKYEDFDEVFNNNPIKLHAELATQIMESEVADDLIHEIQTNKDLKDKLMALDVSRGIRELTRLESKYLNKPKPVVKSAPIPPKVGTPINTTKGDDLAEYQRERAEALHYGKRK